MSSIRKIESSRANGARSHGPATESGKYVSSQNARRHALLARIVLLKDEDPEGFEEVMSDHLARFQPTDGIEFGLVEEMVAAWWRMRRAWSIETDLLNQSFDVPNPGDGTGLVAAAFKSPDNSHGLALLHRYETRLHGVYHRAMKNLLLLQTPRVRNEPNPISEHHPSADPEGVLCPLDSPPGPQPPAPHHAVRNEPSPISEHSSAAPELPETACRPGLEPRFHLLAGQRQTTAAGIGVAEPEHRTAGPAAPEGFSVRGGSEMEAL
jgi:hypothetical protein